MLCGLKVPHDRGLQGHSDAAVGLHTLTDAIYGALCAGDIGTHFPPSDPQWKGAESHIFLTHAVENGGGAGLHPSPTPRSDADLRAAQDRPACGRECEPGWRAAAHRRLPRLGEGHHHRTARLSPGREEGIAALATVTPPPPPPPPLVKP